MFDLEPGEMIISKNILGQVTVTLSFHDHGWQKLEMSESWQEVLRILEESQKGRIRSFRPIPKGGLVMVDCRSLAWKRLWNRLFYHRKKHKQEVSYMDREYHQ